MVSIVSISSSKTIESWTFAALSITQSGMPLRSETRWRLEPAFFYLSDSLRFLGRPFGRDARRVQTRALPLYLVGFAKTIQEHPVQPLPDPCLLPLTQASPARNSRATAHLLGNISQGMPLFRTK